MLVFIIWGIFALPFVACLPPPVEGGSGDHPWLGGPRILAADAQFDFKPYELTNACFDCTRPNSSTLYQCDIVFEWFDPNSVKENNVTSCTCRYSWAWDGVTSEQGPNNTFDPQQFYTCYKGYPTAFMMRVNSFINPNNLTLFMSHAYKDSELLHGSFIYPQTWANPSLNLTEIRKKLHSMTYFLPGPILANITGLS